MRRQSGKSRQTQNFASLARTAGLFRFRSRLSWYFWLEVRTFWKKKRKIDWKLFYVLPTRSRFVFRFSIPEKCSYCGGWVESAIVKCFRNLNATRAIQKSHLTVTTSAENTKSTLTFVLACLNTIDFNSVWTHRRSRPIFSKEQAL